MRPVPELFDPQTLVLVLAWALVVVVAIVAAVLGAESGLARVRARRRARAGTRSAETGVTATAPAEGVNGNATPMLLNDAHSRLNAGVGSARGPERRRTRARAELEALAGTTPGARSDRNDERGPLSRPSR